MPTLTVCANCRKTCPICHTTNPKTPHGIWACSKCAKGFGSECCVCGGNKSKKGTSGASGSGQVCDKCFKGNSCVFCGGKI